MSARSALVWTTQMSLSNPLCKEQRLMTRTKLTASMEGPLEENRRPAAFKGATKQWCLQIKYIFYNNRQVRDLQDDMSESHMIFYCHKTSMNKFDAGEKNCNSKQCEGRGSSPAIAASPLPCEGGRLTLRLLFQLTGKRGTCEVSAGIQPNAKLCGITQSVCL